ncbi:MAG: hypothetical protein AVDCRST_MAG18-4898, partial [uncultured Thermomicrobiales bacterium]
DRARSSAGADRLPLRVDHLVRRRGARTVRDGIRGRPIFRLGVRVDRADDSLAQPRDATPGTSSAPRARGRGRLGL